MLIKARVAAGEKEPGRELLDFVEPLIYSSTLDFSAVESLSQTRERIQEKLHQRRGGSTDLDIKLTKGGIRDIEFLVQCLQRLHGGRDPWVRHGGTQLALFRLRDKGFLSDKEYWRLSSAYEFLRHLEHRLQVEEDQQRHTLPKDQEMLELLARRVPLNVTGSAPTAELMMRVLRSHLEEVQEIYERVIHANQPMYYTMITGAPADGVTVVEKSTVDEPSHHAHPTPANVVRFLDQRAPRLGEVLSRSNLRRGAKPFQHFLERVGGDDQYLEWLNSDEILAGYVLDLFEHSHYFAEQLIRNPEMLAELRRLRQYPNEDRRYAEVALRITDAVELRRFFRREMLRLQCESICLRTPIFQILGRTSELADAAIAAAYQVAVQQAKAAHPPSNPTYQPFNQMMVIALGRLGMREFDLASDADLVFVLPDKDAGEHQFWTRVAARIIDRLTAYMGEGVLFAVDTRLRPNGREGELVQLEGGYKEYFSKVAEAWEGITYLKSRAVAGNTERATTFLNELQELDWRRYGQSGRSQKQLRQMRMRLEREQGAANPLKAGRGGFYDIDFALMYLRLKGAGIFYKVLNTPERIDIIEKMGHVERADAAFLHDAATFYRALDHGIRVSVGYTEGSLPKSSTQIETLSELVSRWTPYHLHDQPLAQELEQIRERTREYFDRLFGTD
jgi:glutamate-ammonia-ligase adenylyltransferase